MTSVLMILLETGEEWSTMEFLLATSGVYFVIILSFTPAVIPDFLLLSSTSRIGPIIPSVVCMEYCYSFFYAWESDA